MQKHVFEEFSSYLQNEKSTFLNCFSSLQHGNHLFESFSILKNKKARFFETLLNLQNEKTRF